MNLIRDRSFPASFDTWAEGLRSVRAADAASRLAPRNSWSCMAATTNRCRSSTPGRSPMVTEPPTCASCRGPDTTSATTHGRLRSCSVARAAALGAGPQHLARPVAQLVRPRLTRAWLCRLPSAPSSSAHGESFLGAAHVGNRARLVVAERADAASQPGRTHAESLAEDGEQDLDLLLAVPGYGRQVRGNRVGVTTALPDPRCVAVVGVGDMATQPWIRPAIEPGKRCSAGFSAQIAANAPGSQSAMVAASRVLPSRALSREGPRNASSIAIC